MNLRAVALNRVCASIVTGTSMDTPSYGGIYLAAKHVVVVILFVAGMVWYTTLETKTIEDLSMFLVCIYFMSVVVICNVLYRLADCVTHCRRHSMRRRARIYIYAVRPRMFRNSIGEALDFGVTILSVFSCFMYIVETYMPFLSNSSAWQFAELVISLIFLMDYVLRFCLSYDPLAYALSTFGVINVITVLPVIVYTLNRLISVHVLHETFNPTVGSGAKLTYLRLLRLAKLMRILRSMNVIQTTSSEGLRREIFTLVFTVLCMIFSAAGVYQWLENAEACFSLNFGNTLYLEEYNTPGFYSENGCVYFHEAFYWCSITVLGRPRMIMKDHWTIVMLIGLVALSVVLIPRHIASVINVLQQTTVHQRVVYKKSSSTARHIVVVGHKEFAAVNMLLYELFHPDRGDHPVEDVVLLFPQKPDRDIMQLLAHPAYVGHAVYLQGSPLQEKDMERASIGTAAGVIVLANKDSENPRWHDGELLTCIQSMKAYWLKGIVQAQPDSHFGNSRDVATKRLRPRIVAQVLLPETKEYLIELPGWTDRDVVVVCTEYVAWMVAMATVARGLATVVFNLTSHAEKQKFYRTKWYPRYEDGATHEIYSLKLGDGCGLDGTTTAEAAKILAKHRVLLIAVERIPEAASGAEKVLHTLHLFPGPPDFVLSVGDRLFCVALSNPALRYVFSKVTRTRNGSNTRGELTWAPTRTFRVGDGLNEEDGYGHLSTFTSSKSHEKPEHRVSWPKNMFNGLGFSDGDGTMTALPTDAEIDNSFVRQVSARGVPRGCEEVFQNTSLEAEEMRRCRSPLHRHTLRTPRASHRKGSGDGNLLLDVNASVQARQQDVLTCLRKRDPVWSDHIVICGLPQTQVGRLGGRGLVTELLETLLRSESIGPRPHALGTRICILEDDADKRMADLCMLEPMLEEAALQGQLRAVSTDPRRREKLLHEADIGSAMAVIALPEHVSQAHKREMSTVADGDKAPKTLKQILDTNTVLTMQVARGCSDRVRCLPALFKPGNNPDIQPPSPGSALSHLQQKKIHGVTLLLQESTSNLFFGQAQMRHAGAAVCDPRWMDISPLNMSPLFASGELLAMTCFDRFAVEAFFTPQVVPLIRMFFFGDSLGSRLYQVACPDDYCGEFLIKLVDDLIPEGQIPLGVLRSPDIKGSTFNLEETKLEPDELADLPDAALPYVITNPVPEKFVLRKSDLLFIIGDRTKSSILARPDNKAASQVATYGYSGHQASIERDCSSDLRREQEALETSVDLEDIRTTTVTEEAGGPSVCSIDPESRAPTALAL